MLDVSADTSKGNFKAARPVLKIFMRYQLALVCLNHYLINHTSGKGRLQGFALKVAKILGHRYPSDRTAAAKMARESSMETFHAAAHPVSKRNMLYILDHAVPGLTAAWYPGTPRPTTAHMDATLGRK